MPDFDSSKRFVLPTRAFVQLPPRPVGNYLAFIRRKISKAANPACLCNWWLGMIFTFITKGIFQRTMFFKGKVFIIALVSTVTVTVGMAQNTKAIIDKNIELIVGTWKVQRILSGNTEVAKNPTSGQWIEFRGDGRYRTHATAMDSGSYRLNENSSTLYLESVVLAKEEGKNVSEFNISFAGDLLTMQRTQQKKARKNSQSTDSMKYVYVRIADGSSHLSN